MPSSLFLFFEVIADELGVEPSRVITRSDLQLNAEHAPLLDDLKAELNVSNSRMAIQKAVETLKEHFAGKGADLPFSYDENSGRFTAVDNNYLEFVRLMSNIRSIGKRSKEFELGVLGRLRLRAIGSLHRVGHPRDVHKTSIAFNKHLKSLGFDGKVLVGKDKDGGFDILWLLPLGTFPHRPIVSIQCKNGVFKMAEADASVAAAGRSLTRHLGLQNSVHVPCVLFNDYLFPQKITPKQMNFVPLGLSDLSALRSLIFSEAI